jgi:hypothetical protein
VLAAHPERLSREELEELEEPVRSRRSWSGGIRAANCRRAEVTEDSVDVRQTLADRGVRLFTSSPMDSARG